MTAWPGLLSTPSSTCASGAGSFFSPPRSMGGFAPRGIGGRWGSSSSATSKPSGGRRWSTGGTTWWGSSRSILMSPKVWEASGHVETFTDPLVECTNCNKRFRADHVDLAKKCPECGQGPAWTEPRQFHLMFKTHMGPIEDSGNVIYLRPETAQGMFVDFADRSADVPQEDPVRDRAARQVVPQRDHSWELRLPHARVRADGDGVLRQAGHRRRVARLLAQGADELVHRPRDDRRASALARARGRRALALCEAHVRHRVRLPRDGLVRARGHREPHRLRPEGALRRTPGRT